MAYSKKCYLKCEVENPTNCEPVCTAEGSLSVPQYLFIMYLLSYALVVLPVVYKYRGLVFHFTFHLLMQLWFLILSLFELLHRLATRIRRMRPLLEGTSLTQEAVQAMQQTATAARDRLREVIRLVNENELESVLNSIHQSEYLRDCTFEAINARRTFQAQGILGNAMQLGGIVLVSANPLAWCATVVGAMLTAISDREIRNQTRTIQNHENRSMEIFDRESRRFRNLESALRQFDRAVRLLNEDFLRYVGRSIYDPVFRDFVLYQVFGADRSQDIATADRDHIGALTNRQVHTNERLNRNQLEILRDSAVMPLVRYVARFMESEQVALGRTVVFSATALTPIPGATHLKGGELVARCITMYKDFKADKITINELNNGIRSIKTQFSAMDQMHDALSERGLRG